MNDINEEKLDVFNEDFVNLPNENIEIYNNCLDYEVFNIELESENDPYREILVIPIQHIIRVVNKEKDND